MQKRGILKNKKAEVQHELYEILIQLSLIILAATGLFLYVDSLANNTLFEKITVKLMNKTENVAKEHEIIGFR